MGQVNISCEIDTVWSARAVLTICASSLWMGGRGAHGLGEKNGLRIGHLVYVPRVLPKYREMVLVFSGLLVQGPKGDRVME